MSSSSQIPASQGQEGYHKLQRRFQHRSHDLRGTCSFLFTCYLPCPPRTPSLALLRALGSTFLRLRVLIPVSFRLILTLVVVRILARYACVMLIMQVFLFLVIFFLTILSRFLQVLLVFLFLVLVLWFKCPLPSVSSPPSFLHLLRVLLLPCSHSNTSSSSFLHPLPPSHRPLRLPLPPLIPLSRCAKAALHDLHGYSRDPPSDRRGRR